MTVPKTWAAQQQHPAMSEMERGDEWIVQSHALCNLWYLQCCFDVAINQNVHNSAVLQDFNGCTSAKPQVHHFEPL